MIIATIGISGSGKSRLGNLLKNKINNLEIVCPDDIRKEVNGNISSQDNRFKVFSIRDSRVKEALKNGKNVFLSETNLTSYARKNLYLLCKETGAQCLFVIMEDSYDDELCRSRVKKDIESGVERSNTLNVDETNKDVITKQHEKFCQMSKNIVELLNEESKKYGVQIDLDTFSKENNYNVDDLVEKIKLSEMTPYQRCIDTLGEQRYFTKEEKELYNESISELYSPTGRKLFWATRK